MIFVHFCTNLSLISILLIILFIIPISGGTFCKTMEKFEYNGSSWMRNWTHDKIKKDDRYVDFWRKPVRIVTSFIVDRSDNESLKATSEEWDFVKKSAEAAMDIARRLLLEVRSHSRAKILIPRRCGDHDRAVTGSRPTVTTCHADGTQPCTPTGICYELSVPYEHSGGCYHGNSMVFDDGPGVEADLLVYFTIKSCDGGFVANAIYCQKDPQYNRPMAGRVLVCRNKIADYIRRGRQMVNVLLHEFFHILIHPMSGDTYVTMDGQLRHDETYQSERRIWKSPEGDHRRETYISTLPSVVRVVREHFRCHQLIGADFDYSLNATDFAHMEARLFPETLMSPVHITGLELSKLDVAFVVDTGWYVVDESMGRNLSVTKGKGCEFVRTSCYEYMMNGSYDRAKIYPYCNEADKGRWMCSMDATHTSYCMGYTKKSRDIFREFHLSSSEEGFYGERTYDYCPMVVPNYVHADTSPYCQEQPYVDYRIVGSFGGEISSRCVRFDRLKIEKSAGESAGSYIERRRTGVCVKSVCAPDEVRFELGGRVHKCSTGDRGKRMAFEIEYNGYRSHGVYCCPDFETFCKRHENRSLNLHEIASLDFCRSNSVKFSVILKGFTQTVIFVNYYLFKS